MASLERNLRKDLEKTVKAARRAAEAGARKAVSQLGVGEAEAPKHLSADQRALRNRLRAHGRQLGDRRDAKTGVQDTARLVQECAYEHWHRMLFARFLAETDLLIEPDSGVAITLDEVQELAREKAADWLEPATDYAERMLPQIFRKDDPVLDIALPPETRSEMEDLLKALPKPVFDADDSLGWVYQFWQAEKKEAVNESELKIGADELPAVTQLFTEDYMVLFLLHNTLGAWWAGKVLADNLGLVTSALDEAALRAACKVGDIDWTYLRFVRETGEDGTQGPWRPAAGAFESWPKEAKGLTVLDPCMGSGHFLVFALPILVAFRIAEEGLSQSAAVDAVLKDNLFGLEIDPRCTQIAAFNLAFAAWRKVGHRPLPQLNLACSGLAIGVTKAEWLKLAEKAVTAADPAAKRDLLGVEQNLLTVGLEERVKNGLEALYDLFAKAPWLGSLIDPRRGADIFREGFDKLEPLLESILAAADTEDAREMAVAAQGMAKAAEILSSKFVLVATNVPFVGKGDQHDVIRTFVEEEFNKYSGNLATAFLARCLSHCFIGGTIGLVIIQDWLFLNQYGSLRKDLLRACAGNLLAKMGAKAFATPMWDFNTMLCIATSSAPGAGTKFSGFDISDERSPEQKASALQVRDLTIVDQSKIAPKDYIIQLGAVSKLPRLSEFAESFTGIQTGDDRRYRRVFWEIAAVSPDWRFDHGTVQETCFIGGRSGILRWTNNGLDLRNTPGAYVRGTAAWGRRGISVSQMNALPVSLYSGEAWNMNCATIIPKDPLHLPALWEFCRSPEFAIAVREINQSLKVNPGYFLKIPFDIGRWSADARGSANGVYDIDQNNADPTQWIFSGHPARCRAPLQIALCRLMGYSWPRQSNVKFLDCTSLDSDGIERHADADGIVCLNALKGEPPAEQRLNAILAEAFSVEWSAAKLSGLLSEVRFSSKSLDDWLRDGFFAQHCEMFQQRPFIWHIWDGRRDGFHALVNYHRLAAPNGEGRRTLEKLIYSYLGDWIDGQRAHQKAGVEGADARLAHAEHLKAELIKILEGAPPYDIFVRWKPLHEQPLGWDPDSNDGVRMNIRPFMIARPLNGRGANACILRTAPKIKWDKDGGKEQSRGRPDYPWFWGWDEAAMDFVGGKDFDGNRWNDLHYSRALKQAARDRHRVKSGSKK
jgi:hypothetical protein